MATPSSEQRGFNRLLVAGYLAGAWGGLLWLYAYAPVSPGSCALSSLWARSFAMPSWF